MIHTTEKEKEFLRKYAELCKEYDMVIVSEDPAYGTVLCSGEFARSSGDKAMLASFKHDMDFVRNGLVCSYDHYIGKKVTFRDTGRSGYVTIATCLFSEGPCYEAIMDDDGSVVHFNDDDNFYIT